MQTPNPLQRNTAVPRKENPRMKMQQIFALVTASLIALLVSGCNNELNRESAAEEIARLYPQPIVATLELSKSAFRGANAPMPGGEFGPRDREVIAELERRLNELALRGYLSYKKEPVRRSLGSMPLGNIRYTIEPKRKLEEWIVERDEGHAQVVIGQVEFTGISGITAIGETRRQVEYTRLSRFNELASFIGVSGQDKSPSDKAVIFIRYDDGWRLVNESTGKTMTEMGKSTFREEMKTWPEIEGAGDGSPQTEERANDPGAVLFAVHCSDCHGVDGTGRKGVRDLVNEPWLWEDGGKQLVRSIAQGANPNMPGFPHSSLDEEALLGLVDYVKSLAGHQAGHGILDNGRKNYNLYCSGCHGVDGEGVRLLLAPPLNSGRWLYGGDPEDIELSIRAGRSGECPGAMAFNERAEKESGWGPASSPREALNHIVRHVFQLAGRPFGDKEEEMLEEVARFWYRE
jgi:mono/diheme cytochrome c family protein